MQFPSKSAINRNDIWFDKQSDSCRKLNIDKLLKLKSCQNSAGRFKNFIQNKKNFKESVIFFQ